MSCSTAAAAPWTESATRASRSSSHDQRDYLADFWERSDVQLPGQPAEQQATRWCLFQLAQASARSDQWGIPAKGVTGSGYEGHYFWDTEVYVVPFLTFTEPRWARNALRFRSNLLPKARERARELNQRGALFPWRTINGDEASAYYAAGTAQYHINADVAYAFSQYVDVTGDVDFQHRDGVRVLVETARMWADLGFWRLPGRWQHVLPHQRRHRARRVHDRGQQQHVHQRRWRRYNLRRCGARGAGAAMRRTRPSTAVLASSSTSTSWSSSSGTPARRGCMWPRTSPSGSICRRTASWNARCGTSRALHPEAFPLLLNFHPLVIYRFQVLKQADVVLALFLRGSEFTAEEKRADFEYYDPITTGDSSLSAVVQSIMAAEVGHQTAALDYFRAGLFVDLGDLHHNTSDGVHIASAGGVWNALVHGFGGMRHDEGRISFDPRLPADWPELELPADRARLPFPGAGAARGDLLHRSRRAPSSRSPSAASRSS